MVPSNLKRKATRARIQNQQSQIEAVDSKYCKTNLSPNGAINIINANPTLHFQDACLRLEGKRC